MSNNSPITSISAAQPLIQISDSNPSNGFDHNSSIHLSVRGHDFPIHRDELTSLPESILLCLFPNGILFEDNHSSDNVVYVDFDPGTLTYVLAFFRGAAKSPPEMLVSSLALVPGKVAIIVLKEDLDFYVIPPAHVETTVDVNTFRQQAGDHLVSNTSIFAGLRKGEDNTASAEQHLIDMLCASGFDKQDTWAKRFLEPSRACITSLALVLLRPNDPATGMATSQKLLLFWRKPARKCWWDSLQVKSKSKSGVEELVKVWARRVWTLELSITG